MTWDRSRAAPALAALIEAAADPLVTVFEAAPDTLNAPALVCSEPARVAKRTAGMGVDECEFVVIGLTGLDQSDQLAALLDTVDKAVMSDPTLGGVAQTSMVTEYRNWRPVSIGGANFRAADAAIRIDM